MHWAQMQHEQFKFEIQVLKHLSWGKLGTSLAGLCKEFLSLSYYWIPYLNYFFLLAVTCRHY